MGCTSVDLSSGWWIWDQLVRPSIEVVDDLMGEKNYEEVLWSPRLRLNDSRCDSEYCEAVSDQAAELNVVSGATPLELPTPHVNAMFFLWTVGEIVNLYSIPSR